ncbi:MAG: phosphopantetheine-binding protein [Nocardioides sp.]|nr:phosphopantetheine-binding protein [Nocardioides sp.]
MNVTPEQVEPARIEKAVTDFLSRLDKLVDGFDAQTSLYADGAGLDSLETAELSAVLEDEFGTDPFSCDEMPETLADIVVFYGAVKV